MFMVLFRTFSFETNYKYFLGYVTPINSTTNLHIEDIVELLIDLNS